MNTFYTGGLAELVHNPSPITFTYLSRWLTGSESVGRALELLELPYRAVGLPLLVQYDGQVYVDLEAEESTVFADTLLRYRYPARHDLAPGIRFAWSKLVSFRAWRNTFQLIKKQSLWVAFPDTTVHLARSLVEDIPTPKRNSSEKELDRIIRKEVLPRVIALGYLTEPFQRLPLSEKSQRYITAQIAKQDWLYRSIADQYAVKSEQLSFEAYMREYGLRADQDYELSDPRWYEIPNIIRKRIAAAVQPKRIPNAVPLPGATEINQAKAVIELLRLRSEARRRALPFFDLLRKQIKPEMFTKTNVSRKRPQTSTVTSGKGTPVSRGIARGKIQLIETPDEVIAKGTIGIFPNASPTFATQFPRCTGLIFLQGGQTSHGAIVAREFGIPAIIDRQAAQLGNNSLLTLDGTTGHWRLLH